MTEIKVDNVQNAAGSGKPNFPISPTHSTGSALSTLNTCEYDTTARVVTVVNDGGNKYAIDGVTTPTITLLRGVTYVFDLSDSSNSNHPLAFKNSGTSYTTGITSSGTAGSANATVTFAVPSDAPLTGLTYYCTVHGDNMGSSVTTSDPNNGALLWDNTNSAVKVFIDNEFKEIQLNSSSGGAAFNWGGDRGVFANGYENGNFRNDIDYVDITTAGNATDFGDATVGRNGARSTGSTTRFVFGLGWTGSVYTLTLDYITTATTGNASDFGDHTVTDTRGTNAGIVSSGTRGLFGGGYASAFTNAIHYITIANTGNTTDFGDLTVARNNVAGAGDGSRGLFSGGQNASYTLENVIDYVTIDTAGNATDFGDLTLARKEGQGAADTTRSLFLGGAPSTTAQGTVIDYVTTQTAGNATDFGDLLSYRFDGGASSNGTKALCTGYYAGATSNVIEQVTIQTAANATDFGDLTVARTGMAGGSGTAS